MNLLPNGYLNSGILSRVIYPGLPIMGPPYGKRDPCYSHTIPTDFREFWQYKHLICRVKGEVVTGEP